MIDRVRLGHSELYVSSLCLGSMNFGWKEPREASLERLNQYAEAGGNFIDTANVYTRREAPGLDLYGKDIDKFEDGMSERLIGSWLGDGRRREDFIIATKVGFSYPGIEIGTSAKQIREECEKSLKRLGTDYIDLYYLHMDDKTVPLAESLGELTALVKEGKTRYIGLSNFTVDRLIEAEKVSEECGFEKFVCVQNKCSYLRPREDADFGRQVAADERLFEYAKKKGIALLAYSPLIKGYYADRTKALAAQYVSTENEARLKVLDKVANECGISEVQAVYAWLLSHNPRIIPLVASSSKKQFEEALGALNVNFTTEQKKRLDEA